MPDVQAVISPILPSLPGAAIATQPAPAVLPLLSPILRQRVTFLSAASTEPWGRWLTYDTAQAARLAQLSRGESFEPHPVSGEVEVDWDADVEVRYKRLDIETIHGLAWLRELGLAVLIVYCVNDQEGGGDGWRIAEITCPEASPFPKFGGFATVKEAEDNYQASAATPATQGPSFDTVPARSTEAAAVDDNEDDDDDYWARYDATPARTPAIKRSPAPASMQQSTQMNAHQKAAAEDAYFAQYDSVQPAMDNHDPDEAAAQADFAAPPPPLGLARPTASGPRGIEDSEMNETNGGWTMAERSLSQSSRHSRHTPEEEERLAALVHPRPESASSRSSNVSLTVAKLEEDAGKREQSEFGVKQHVSRSIKSLFMLSRSSGIDRDEFERMVKTELDALAMLDDD